VYNRVPKCGSRSILTLFKVLSKKNKFRVIEPAANYPYQLQGRDQVCFLISRFPLGKLVRANRKKSDLIGWRQTLTTSPTNHIHVFLVRAKKVAEWKAGFKGLELATE
jgi:hypothetical protein